MEDEKMVEVETEEIMAPEDYDEDIVETDEETGIDIRLLALSIGAVGGLAALGAAKFVGWVTPKARNAKVWFRNKTRKKGDPIEATCEVVDNEETETDEDSEKK